MNVIERFTHVMGGKFNVLMSTKGNFATDLSKTYGFGVYDDVLRIINIYPAKKTHVVEGSLQYIRPKYNGLQYVTFNDHYYNDVPVEMACKILHTIKRCEEWKREIPKDKSELEAKRVLVIISHSKDCCVIAHRMAEDSEPYKEYDKNLEMEIDYKPDKLKVSGDLESYMMKVVDINDF